MNRSLATLATDFDDLLDAVYEAAAIPDLWPCVLERIGTQVGMHGAALFAVDPDLTVRWTASKRLEGLVLRFISEGWMDRNSRAARLGPMRYPGFVGDFDLFTQEEMDRDPFYTDLLRPIGLGWGAGTIILSPTEDVVVLTVEGSSGPVSREDITFLDRLRPHLCRAALLSARMRLERARSAVDVLERLRIPAAALESDGQVMLTNQPFDGLDDRFVLRCGRAMTLNPSSNPIMMTALAALSRGDARGGACSLPVRGTADHPPAIIHLIPIRGAVCDVFAKAFCILVVTPLAPPQVASADLLHGLFDLTPAEARVAAAVGAGLSPGEAAGKLGVSVETVRAQLKQVFLKTGVSRQSELVAILPKLAFR